MSDTFVFVRNVSTKEYNQHGLCLQLVQFVSMPRSYVANSVLPTDRRPDFSGLTQFKKDFVLELKKKLKLLKITNVVDRSTRALIYY